MHPPSRRTRPHHPARRHAHTLLTLLAATAVLAACGTSGGAPNGGVPNDGPPDGGPPTAPLADATSVSCSAVRGLSALYWDYMNGIVRLDYPETYRFLPYAPGTPFIHAEQPLYNFIHPSSWNAVALTHPSLRLTGANVVRPDERAVWRRLDLTLSGALTATDVLAVEVDQMLRILGVTEPVERICSLTLPDDSRTSRLLTAGDFTANVSVQVYPSTFLGAPVTTAFVQVAVAPTPEYEDTVVGVFFPLSGQMTLGGGSGSPECSDGIDNDGDGRIDYPDDPGCSSEVDDDESG